MKQKKILMSMVVLSSLTACSVHPLPDDVSPDDTISIVRKVRCEAKEVLKGIFLEILSRDLSDPGTRAVYNLVKYENHDFGEPEIKMLGAAASARLLPWFNSGIGMTFVLTATEDNNGSASAKFGLPFTDGAFNLTLNAGRNLKRKNARTVKLAESWGVVAERKCSDISVAHRNLLYPITGRVGMAEVLNTYFKLRRGLGNLEEQRVLEDFSDKLTFTTELTGGLTPALELKAVSDKFRLANANGEFKGTRKDEHDLTIALTLPPKPKPKTENLVVKLAENVTLTVKVPKKYIKQKPEGKPGVSTKPTTGGFNFTTPPEQRDEIIQKLDKLDLLDTNRQILNELNAE